MTKIPKAPPLRFIKEGGPLSEGSEVLNCSIQSTKIPKAPPLRFIKEGGPLSEEVRKHWKEK